MISVLWEIVLPLLGAFVVGWVVMGWLTWRWRRAGVSKARWARVNAELEAARAQIESTNGSGPGPAEPAASERPPVDDLKAIRGVGAKMEAKLQELGITSLHQVAAFTDDDTARVSAGIGAFPGRIERDRWVPQAKELAARLEDGPTGGQPG